MKKVVSVFFAVAMRTERNLLSEKLKNDIIFHILRENTLKKMGGFLW